MKEKNFEIEAEKPPRKKNDQLFKGAFEEHFQDLLRLIFKDADQIFDFEKGL